MKSTSVVFGRSFQAALATSILALMACPAQSRAQFEITTGTGSTAQNFDTLINTGNGTWTNDTTLVPGDSTLDGWSLFNSANSPIITYAAGTGSSATGSFYSFGASGDPERALGGQGSGGGYFGSPVAGTPAGYIAFAATNHSSSTLTSFTLGYDGEQWRNGGNANPQPMVVQYGFGPSFDVVTWTAPGGAFNFVSPVTGLTAAAVDGNTTGRVAGLGGTVNGLTWMAGETLWLRWIELNDTGNDHGLALDNFSLSWLAGTLPKSLMWSPGASNVWDTSTANFQNTTPAPATFANGDTVTFGDTGVGTVVVQAAGVAPAATNVTNTTGTYTFRGGPITGTGSLTKSGAGTLILQGQNTYSGFTTINEGTVQIAEAANIGTGTLVLGGGTLQTASGGVTLARDVVVNAGGTIHTNGFDSVITGNTTVTAGTFVKAGAGDLRITGLFSADTATGPLQIDAGTVTLARPATTNPQVFVNLSLGVLNGDLVLGTPIRLNVNRGISSGTGKIRIAANQATIGQTGLGLTATIGNDLVLNSTDAAGPFVANLNTTSGNTLIIDGVISGASDLNFATSATSGGAGTVELLRVNTYTGATLFNQSAAGVVKLGVNNALPVGTSVIFGTNTGTLPGGSLDLNGFSQTIASLSSGATGTVGSAKITNNAAAGLDSVLTINGPGTTPETFLGVISDGFNGGKLTVNKASANELTIDGQGSPQSFSTLNVTAGTLNLLSGVNAPEGSTVTVTGARLNISADQTLNALTIGAGAVALLSPAEPVMFGEFANAEVPLQAVPEPTTAGLFALGLLGALLRRHRN